MNSTTSLREWFALVGKPIRRPTGISYTGDPNGRVPELLKPDEARGTVSPALFAEKYVGTKTQRVCIIDSGSSSNTLRESRAKKTLKDFIGSTQFTLEFETVNHKAKSNIGVHAQIGLWDVPSDFLLFPKAPDIISVGERCTFAGFSSLWVYQCQPCFISFGGRYIIIFEVDNLVPIWGPHHEKLDEFLGTFEFKENVFYERCGVYINDRHEVCL